jgi:hypothetical protein
MSVAVIHCGPLGNVEGRLNRVFFNFGGLNKGGGNPIRY